MEVSAILIAHRGKGDGAAFRQSGLVYKIAAGDLKIGQVGDVAYIHSFGKQAAGDGKRGATSSGENLAVKQAVADGDGSVIIRKLHTLFKGPAIDLSHVGGGVYLNSFLKGAAGDGAVVVVHLPFEGAVGDGVVVVHILLEGTAGDGFVVDHLPLEGTVGDGAVVVRFPLEGTIGDGAAEVVHLPLEGTAGDGALIVGKTADGTAVKFGIFINIESCPQCAFRLSLRGGLQGEGALMQFQVKACCTAICPMFTVALTFGMAFGVQLDGNAVGGAVFCVQITAAAGGGFLLGAAGGVGLLYKGCSLFGRGLGGCIEHRGSCQCRHRQQGQQHTAGQQDAYNAFGFHKVSLLSCGFYTGCRYHKYTIN